MKWQPENSLIHFFSVILKLDNHRFSSPMISSFSCSNVLFSLYCLIKNAHYWPTKSNKNLESANKTQPPQAEQTIKHKAPSSPVPRQQTVMVEEEKRSALLVYFRQLNHCHLELMFAWV